jgi:phage terminase large subunit
VTVTADQLADAAYERMKRHSPARVIYDAMQADDANPRALLDATDADTRTAVVAYAARRAYWRDESPEYAAILHDREDWSTWMRADPARRVAALKRYYRNGHIAEFIDDWGMTSNPKMANAGRAVSIPFKLWPRQRELVAWLWKHFRESTPAVCAKAREVGASWIAMAFSASLCALFDDIVVGVVASTEDKLDSTKDPSPTLPKAREFLRHLPPEFTAGYDDTIATSTYLKVHFPTTRSIIKGWTGKTAGRGGRAALVIVDEAAFFEQPRDLDGALSAVTECRLDFSSANGTGNPFFERVTSGHFDTFWFRIDDDPRRDKAWQERKKLTMDPVIWEAEYAINFTASIESQLIEWKWVEAAIDLHTRLGLKITGGTIAALDVSDQGRDRNSWVCRHGVLLQYLQSWSGAGSDQHATCSRAFRLCDEHGHIRELIYDASSPGAGIAGAGRILNDTRANSRIGKIALRKFVGGGTDFPAPEAVAKGTDRSQEDFFANMKAFVYWELRQRFIETWKAANGLEYDPDAIICIDKNLPELTLLMNELAQIQRKTNASGDKLAIDKIGTGQRSPNHADAVAMLFGMHIQRALKITPEILEATATRQLWVR